MQPAPVIAVPLLRYHVRTHHPAPLLKAVATLELLQKQHSSLTSAMKGAITEYDNSMVGVPPTPPPLARPPGLHCSPQRVAL